MPGGSSNIRTLGRIELEFERQSVALLRAIVSQQIAAFGEILQGRRVSRRQLCALARNQIEFGNLLALLRRCDQRRAAVQLTYDIKYFFIALVWRGLRREQSAD
jgi:hypothetical protein